MQKPKFFIWQRLAVLVLICIQATGPCQQEMLRVLQQELTWSEIVISRHPKLSLQCPCTIDSNIVLLHPYSFKKQEIAVKIKKTYRVLSSVSTSK